MNDSLIELRIPLKEIPQCIQNVDTSLTFWLSHQLKCLESECPSYEIVHKSIDARKKNNIFLNYKVSLNSSKIDRDSAIKNIPNYPKPIPSNVNVKNPVIVGAGPAGLLSAYLLALAGTNPIILERGQPVEQRTLDINLFRKTKHLNSDSNYLYGEGGAGTYSDGKLYTRVKDERCKFILDLFAACGAPSEICYLQRPHIGSNRLPSMIKKMRSTIEHLGGRFLWGSTVDSFLLKDDICYGVNLSNGEKIESSAVVLACGHSSRNLMKTMALQKIAYQIRDFQMGCRIEHPQSFINLMQYGMLTLPPQLPVPEYHLVSRPVSKQILSSATFCMCPGGEIIPAIVEEGKLSTNGMSPYERDLCFANSAMIATLSASAFPTIDLIFNEIERIETNCWNAGGGGCQAPAQDASAFIRGEKKLRNPQNSSYQFGLQSYLLNELMPSPLVQSLRAALVYYDKLMPGFIEKGRFIGVETRVSSPIRWVRDKTHLFSLSHQGLYPVGEGAGQAGGIMSAAIDGLRGAESILGMIENDC